jgi:hypothetical protein
MGAPHVGKTEIGEEEADGELTVGEPVGETEGTSATSTSSRTGRPG